MAKGRSSKAQKRRAASVVIVGGGIMGCAAAYELAKSGASVTVLERSVPGAEASSAAAGILGAQVEAHAPGPLTELGLASRKLYPKWVRELEQRSGIAVGYRRAGVLKVGYDRVAVRRLLREVAWQGRAKLPLERLAARALRTREPALSEKLAGGVRFEADALIDPRALLAALRVSAEQCGAEFRSGSFVKRIAFEGGRAAGVELDDGDLVRGSHVVLAAGSWTSLVAAPAERTPRVVPARGQIVELKTSVPLLSSVVFGPDCYLVPRADGRLLVGSTLEFVGFRREVTAGAVAKLLSAAIRLVPALADAELLGSWASFRPYTPDELPLLGPSASLGGLIMMSGHYRNGILLAPISARIVAACVLGLRPPLRLEPFSPDRRASAPERRARGRAT
ncbi:MAG TPA: glycine oxidase ThiO [Polyangiaceae bacterium]|nr:glycine oxidase ThiO [Polyangiaceae bacterium]